REARGRAAPGRGLAVRAEVGRIPRARVPRRRRAAAPEPRPQAVEPLLPRTRAPASGAASRALRRGRRARDHGGGRPRLRGAPAPPPPRALARGAVAPEDPGVRRPGGPAVPGRRRPARPPLPPARVTPRKSTGVGPPADLPDADHPR